MRRSSDITVVVPARNAEATLVRALASLQAQTHSRWTAIVVDDRSDDDTLRIASMVGEADGRITVLPGPGRGVSAARNVALAAARTDWLCFLDADDEVDADFLERMLAATAEADLVYCGYRRKNECGAVTQEVCCRKFADGGFPQIARGAPPTIHSVLVLRETVMAAGGFDESLQVAEDRDLWQRLARSGARVRFVDAILATYYTCPNTLSRRFEDAAAGALQVLSRAYAPDLRVRSTPEYAEGLRTDDQELYAAFIVAWFAAAAAGAGQTADNVLRLLPQAADVAGHERQIAATLLDGLLIGARRGTLQLLEVLTIARGELDDVLHRFAAAQSRGHAATGLVFALEFEALRRQTGAGSAILTRVQQFEVDLRRRLTGVHPAPGVEAGLIDFRDRGVLLARAEIPVVGEVGPGELLTLAKELLGPSVVVRYSGIRAPLSTWIGAFGRVSTQIRLRAVRLRPRALKRAFVKNLSELEVERLGGPKRRGDPVEVARRASRIETAVTTIPTDPVGRPEAWDQVFSKPDPWGYISAYEQEKYAFTLELVPEGADQVLEIACAEGLFTEKLAPRVGRLTAVDISEVALDRARARCASSRKVSFTKLDLTSDPILGNNDVVVCSEVLYYLKNREQLARVVGRLRDALKDGGRLVSAHYNLLSDDPTCTGFDWDQSYGGKVIHEHMAADAQLVLERSIVTDLYRVDCFRRTTDKAAVPEPVVDHRPRTGALDTALEKWVVRGGAVARRSEVQRDEKTWRLPVLEYHRIAHDGPPALARWRIAPTAFERQLQLLRANGYHSVSSSDLIHARLTGHPLPGRPVMITFDDGYQDFADTAWPILERNGFSAEVFIVSSLVGRTSAWDAHLGSAAPLMSWDRIETLARAGVSFGSHLASHTPAPNLPTRALLEEAERSRRSITERIAQEVLSIAPPYGALDERSVRALQAAGFRLAFTTRRGVADLARDGYALPRVEVRGDMPLSEFACELGLSTPTFLQDGDGTPPQNLVSVVVPAFNAEPWLDATLNSVRSQTHRALDIIVVDDGSTDRTAEIAERHAAADPRVRLVRRPNGGLAVARNTGIAAARGEFLAPVDADDLWAPTKIEKQLLAMRRGGPETGLVYTWYAAVDAAGRTTGIVHAPMDEGDVLRRMCRGNLVGNGSAALMRTEAVRTLGGYDESLRAKKAQGCEDLLLYYKLAECWRTAVVPETLTGYRQLPTAMSADFGQMWRSYRLVAERMRSEHPELSRDVREGLANFALYLFWKAVGAGRRKVAARMLALHICHARGGAIRSLSRALRTPLRRGTSTPEVSGRGRPFLQGAPG
jgi:glycosyltransferase involved in cell wall biosynthesis/peptidoglycan/xylan/chitin deacetylase (PgdA/CDA1 family)